MLLKKLILTNFLLLTTSLTALEINISTSDSTEVKAIDVERFKVMLQQRNMGMSDENAKIAIEENRILADAYIKEYGLPEELKVEMQIILEEKLKNTIIKKEKEDIKINNDVLLSYYKNNKDEFYQSDKLTFNVYTFKDYENANDFYQKNKDNYNMISAYVADNNVSKNSETMLLSKLNKELQVLIKGSESQYITPPEFFYKNYIILDVVAVEKAHVAPFNEVKDMVRAALLSKINQDTKNKLLNKYNKSGNE